MISYGVPQGSILGPLLFLVYINDIAKCSELLDFILFADDTTTFISGKNANEVFRTVNSELFKLQNWLFANKLSLNTLKTKYILFHKTTMADDLPLKFPKVSIDTLSVERMTEFKFLGIYFDENMSFPTSIYYSRLHLETMIYQMLLNHFLKTYIINIPQDMLEMHL